jgi:hypothetical protein
MVINNGAISYGIWTSPLLIYDRYGHIVWASRSYLWSRCYRGGTSHRFFNTLLADPLRPLLPLFFAPMLTAVAAPQNNTFGSFYFVFSQTPWKGEEVLSPFTRAQAKWRFGAEGVDTIRLWTVNSRGLARSIVDSQITRLDLCLVVQRSVR